MRKQVEQFDIDGLRLDVAYLLDEEFLRQLRVFCDGLKPEFFTARKDSERRLQAHRQSKHVGELYQL